MDKRVSVVIPGYNGADLLRENIPHVLRLGADEIIIIDDASTDATSEFLATNYPKIKVITHSKNLGFPISVNEGFAASSTPFVLLLNQDVVPDPRLLTRALTHFKSDSVFAVTFNDGENSWATAKFVSGFIQYGNGLPKVLHSSFWASGGAGLFKKSAWDSLDGFDPIFSPGYFEDQDIGLRAHKAKFEILWDPKCTITHPSPGSTFTKSYAPKDLTHIKERNYLLLHWKNLDYPNLLTHFFFLLLKVLTHPGFIAPTLKALSLVTKLHRPKSFISDQDMFSKFTSHAS